MYRDTWLNARLLREWSSTRPRMPDPVSSGILGTRRTRRLLSRSSDTLVAAVEGVDSLVEAIAAAAAAGLRFVLPLLVYKGTEYGEWSGYAPLVSAARREAERIAGIRLLQTLPAGDPPLWRTMAEESPSFCEGCRRYQLRLLTVTAVSCKAAAILRPTPCRWNPAAAPSAPRGEDGTCIPPILEPPAPGSEGPAGKIEEMSRKQRWLRYEAALPRCMWEPEPPRAEAGDETGGSWRKER